MEKGFLKVDIAKNNEISIVPTAEPAEGRAVYYAEKQWIAYKGKSGHIKVQDYKTGKVLASIQTLNSPSYFVMSPDKKYIVLNSDGAAHFFESETGKFIGSVGEGVGDHTQVHWK